MHQKWPWTKKWIVGIVAKSGSAPKVGNQRAVGKILSAANKAHRPANNGRDRAVTHERENRKLPTDLNPLFALTSYHKKVICVSIFVSE